MGKGIRVRLLKRGIDPLPSGPTVFWRRRSEASSASSPQSTDGPSSPDGPPQRDLPPPPDDPMRPGIDLMERQLSEMARKRGMENRRARAQAQSGEFTTPTPED